MHHLRNHRSPSFTALSHSLRLGRWAKINTPHQLWKSILCSASSRWRVLQARTTGGDLGMEEREAESGSHQRRRKGCWVGKGRGIDDLMAAARRQLWWKSPAVRAAWWKRSSCTFLCHSCFTLQVFSTILILAESLHQSSFNPLTAELSCFLLRVSEQHFLFVYAKLDVFITTWSSARMAFSFCQENF